MIALYIPYQLKHNNIKFVIKIIKQQESINRIAFLYFCDFSMHSSQSELSNSYLILNTFYVFGFLKWFLPCISGLLVSYFFRFLLFLSFYFSFYLSSSKLIPFRILFSLIMSLVSIALYRTIYFFSTHCSVFSYFTSIIPLTSQCESLIYDYMFL